MVIKESNFNTEIVKSVKHHGWFAHKLMDMPASMMVRTRFVPTKPCDILACIKGRMVGIECKQIKKWQGFSLRFLRENQIEALDEIKKAGGVSIVLVNVRIPPEKGISKRENRLIVINWSTWDRELIPVKKMRELPYIEGKLGLFDLTTVISELV
jgi:hypothetical protein